MSVTQLIRKPRELVEDRENLWGNPIPFRDYAEEEAVAKFGESPRQYETVVDHIECNSEGKLVGVVTACWLWGRKNGVSLLDMLDFVAPLVPTGLFFGRMGNFINAELWGKVTDSPLGMIFPGAGPLPRHPSQLYEAGLEGVLTFVILWIYSSRPRPRGAVAGLFSVLYAVSRIAVEFFRVPDAQLGYLFAGWVTMGQILCLPLLAAGLWLLWRAYRPGAGA